MTKSKTQKFKNFQKQILQKFIILFLTFLYILVVPILVVCCIPIYWFRFSISLWKDCFRPDLGDLVNSRSIVLGVDGFPEKPKWNLVVWLTQEGKMDLAKFQTYFEQNFVLACENTKLCYPEYQQSIQKWMGFYFWKWDTCFDISNHIRQYDGKYSNEVIDDKKLVQIIKELTWAPWNPRRSPWEFLQILNYIEADSENTPTKVSVKSNAKSILIFRIHHVLGDGYSILKLLMEDISGISLQTAAQPVRIQRNLFEQLLRGTIFWIQAPFQFVQMMMTSSDTNPWHIPNKKRTYPANAALTERIELDVIKTIKNSHGVSFTAVLNAMVVGGLRRMMIQEGLIPPVEIHQAIPVPMPGHPLKLRNHFIFAFISLPIGTANPIERLQKIEENLQALKHSCVPILNFWKVPLVGSLLPCLMRLFTINHLTTCLMSNFPGTPSIPHFREVDVIDMMFAAGLGLGNTGIGFTLISYVGFIRILSIVDSSILSSDQLVEELNEKILEEMNILKTLGVSTSTN